MVVMLTRPCQRFGNDSFRWFGRHGRIVGKDVLKSHPAKRSIASSQLTIEKTTDPTKFEKRPPKEELVFGTTLSDHMLMVGWEKESGWQDPRIVPYQNLSISPAASSLHYGTS